METGPPIVLGGRFGERPMDTDFGLLDAWEDAGGRLVETAHAYVDGAAELRIGAWLRRRSGDNAPGIVTKIGHPKPGGTPTLDSASLRRQLTISLRRLGIDRVALVLLHRDDPSVAVDRFAESLYSIASCGEADAIGVANWSLPRAQELHAAIGSCLALTSEQWSLARPAAALYPGTVIADEGFLAWHAASGVPLLAWSANAHGWFAGRGNAGPFDTPENRKLREAVTRQSAELGAAPATVALHHTLRGGPSVVATIGSESVQELAEALAATRLDAPPLAAVGNVR